MPTELKAELYRTLLLLTTDPILLKTIESWCAGASEAELVEGLRNWNEAKSLELQEWLPTLSGADMEAVKKKLAEYRASARSPVS
ncbi:MAG TPA: hypothetical protein VEB41_15110 [Burkholderiales bacterium]|nr:hypothetical protein [Burkholderiales bacterium]